jgi:hypothetical protein
MKAKIIKLAYNHPDSAFAYCGIGSVLFHMDEPMWACRCYLKVGQTFTHRPGTSVRKGLEEIQLTLLLSITTLGVA